MTRNRVVTALALVGLVGVGLTLLAAAHEPGDRPPEPAKPTASTDQQLVCLGTVDTEDKMIGIYPDNFPQPSQVTKVLVNEGDEVRKGQPLLELDTEMYTLKVAEAEAGVKAALADLAKAEALVAAHRVEMDYLDKTWKAKQAAVEAKRKELEANKQAAEITKNKNILDIEAATAALQEAELNLDAARIKWQGMKDQAPTYAVELANAGLTRARELKRQAEHALAQATCTAKAAGTIVRSFVSEGSQFGPTVSREPAFWFVKKGPPLVRAEVTQEFAGRIHQNQRATIVDESANRPEDPRWTGKVTRVGNQFLPKRHSSGSALDIFPVNDDRVLECIVSLDLDKGQAPPRFGQKVRIRLEP